MNLLKMALLTAGLVLMLVVALGPPAGSVSAASGSLTLGETTIAPGSSGSVDLRANVGAPGLGAWSIDISYDESVVTAVGCVAPSGFCNTAFPGGGTRVSGASGGGIIGDTLLATITFSCPGPGQTGLFVAVNNFADATPGGPLPVDVTPQNGAITCLGVVIPPTPTPTSPPPTGDPNQDVTVLTDEDVAAAEPVSLPLDQSDLVVTAGQPDVFAFPLSAGDTVEIDAFFSNPGNIDIGLFDPDNLSVAKSESMNDDERIVHVARKTGTYRVKVALVSGDENPYRVRIRSTKGSGPGPSGAGAPPVAAGLPTAGLGGSAGGSASSWALIAAASAGLAALAATARFVGVRRERDTPWTSFVGVRRERDTPWTNFVRVRRERHTPWTSFVGVRRERDTPWR